MERAVAARIVLLAAVSVAVVAAALGVGFGDQTVEERRNTTDAQGVQYVTITFDDGYRSQYDAADALEDRDMHGVFYVSAGQLNGTFEGIPTMTATDVRNLERRGHEIGGHTYNHTDMSTLDTSEVQDSLEWNSAALDDMGVHPVSFAYPHGKGMEHADTVQKYYDYARTVRWRFNTVPPADPMRLNTVAVTEQNRDDFDQRLAQLEGGEWMVIAIHHVTEDVERENVDVTPETYESVLDAVDQPGIEVVTFRDIQGLAQGGES